ncbi:MAG: hypothetical protein IT579_12115 [Verrucomicrobia subdivision 3 bacterium]|nr:hypothetical protein [Limisphaerales bacterium]
MKINIGKWLRRQVFGGEPVTLKTTLELAVEAAGYDSAEELLGALASGKTTGDAVARSVVESARRELVEELARLITRAQSGLEALQRSL